MRRKTLYTLYKRRRDARPGAKWERIGGSGWPMKTAVRVFQNQLISNALMQLEPEYEYRLKPTREK